MFILSVIFISIIIIGTLIAFEIMVIHESKQMNSFILGHILWYGICLLGVFCSVLMHNALKIIIKHFVE